jgi:glutamate-1-semialdehyde 2,1-aminomutase
LPAWVVPGVSLAALGLASPWLYRRWQLSSAKHPSLAGHSRMAKRLAAWLPGYSYADDRFFASDAAPAEVVARRCPKRHGR